MNEAARFCPPGDEPKNDRCTTATGGTAVDGSQDRLRVQGSRAAKDDRRVPLKINGGRPATAGQAGNKRQSRAPKGTHGRCWARTSDLRLVEAALSQLS